MEYGGLCGLEHHCPEAGQGTAEAFAGDKVNVSCQLGQLNGTLGGVEDGGELSAVLFAGNADQGKVIPGILADKATLGEGGVGFAQLQQTAVVVPGGFVPAAPVPEHAPAAVGILRARHAHLVAVVDHGHTGAEKLDGGSQMVALPVPIAQVQKPGGCHGCP